MLITKHITKGCIEPELRATSKAQALETLCQLLFSRRRLEGGAAAVAQILRREAIETTGIGHGIAVPHARLAELEDLVCAVGRVPEGLDYKAVDKQPVRLIFLICYPPAKQATYLNFVANVAKLLRGEGPLDAILAAGSAEEILAILEQQSETLVRPEDRLAEEAEAGKIPDDEEQEVSSDLLLLARLELCSQMLETVRSGRKQIEQRIENISSLLDAELLEQYQRLREGRGGRALVAVEGGVCQGCAMRLPTKLSQEVYRSRGRLHRCPSCNRFIYAV